MVVYEVKKIRRFDKDSFYDWHFVLRSAASMEDLKEGGCFQTIEFTDFGFLISYLANDFLERREFGLKNNEASCDYFNFHIVSSADSRMARIGIASDFYRLPQIQTTPLDNSEFDNLIRSVLVKLAEKNVPGVMIK